MRYYFHLQNSGDSIPDEIGLELEDSKEVRSEAIKAIEEISRENPELAEDGIGWKLIVTDSAGTVVFSLPLDDVTWQWWAFGIPFVEPFFSAAPAAICCI